VFAADGAGIGFGPACNALNPLGFAVVNGKDLRRLVVAEAFFGLGFLEPKAVTAFVAVVVDCPIHVFIPLR
jgi:hypothetical protein